MLAIQEDFQKEMDCYKYCVDTAADLVDRKDYSKAAGYYENAARSLRELDKLSETKEYLNEILILLERPGQLL